MNPDPNPYSNTSYGDLHDPAASPHEQVARRNLEAYLRVAEPILRELRESGLDIASIGEIVERVHSGEYRRDRYRVAVPILLQWLPRISDSTRREGDDTSVREDIVRTLSLPWAKPEAIQPMLAQFRSIYASEGDLAEGLLWTVGNALEIYTEPSMFDDLEEIVTTPKYGQARQMPVYGFWKTKRPEAVDILIQLLDDSNVRLHAVYALGRTKSPRAHDALGRYANDSNAALRREVRVALRRVYRPSKK